MGIIYCFSSLFSPSILHFPTAQGLGWPDPVQYPTSPGTRAEKLGEPQRAWPWAAGERGLREPGEMLFADGSHRLWDADRIRGLEQLKEQGFSKQQMVLDGSQGEVRRVGSRSPSSPGQGRGKSGRSQEEDDFCPAHFQTGAWGGGAGGPDPSPSSQVSWVPVRMSHADAQSWSEPQWQQRSSCTLCPLGSIPCAPARLQSSRSQEWDVDPPPICSFSCTCPLSP